MKNKIFNKIAISSILLAGLGMTSCDDFLTITPTDRIVEEDFWQDKNDLNNAIIGCYKQFTGSNMLNAYINWGELRGDNVERASATSSSGSIANIMNANLLPKYSEFDWTPAYRCINSCNKVLAHGGDVVATDESFSENDWKPVKTEATALRAMAHFLLVRTFGEIPYVTQDYNNDSQELRLEQSTQLSVLNNIINDLESVKDNAMEDYGNTVENKGRITKKAVYALLADVYLWRASYIAGGNQPFIQLGTGRSSYQGSAINGVPRTETYPTDAQSDYLKCIEYCNKIQEIATKEYIKKMEESGKVLGGEKIEVTLEDLLVQNISTSKTATSPVATSSSSAYDKIFGDGNSDESIFEIQFDGVTYGNDMITSKYLKLDETEGSLTGAIPLFESVIPQGEQNQTEPSVLFTMTDMRFWESIHRTSKSGSQNSYPIGKLVHSSVSQQNGVSSIYMSDNTSTTLNVYQDIRKKGNVDANFPIYRMSDIYLMKAEAMSQVAASEEELSTAFAYVREVFKRSNPYAYAKENTKKDSLEFDKFKTNDAFELLVIAERQREFLFEGKRWFDLVRFAQRHGTTSKMLEMLTRKYSANKKAIKSKLANMQTLFSPVYREELYNNNLLYQNGVWVEDETSSKTDNL